MDRAPLVTVEVERRDDLPVVLVRVIGELDFGSTPRLLDAVTGQPPAGFSIILDLSGVEFCDSSALGAMIAMHKAAEARGGRLFLTGPRPQVQAAVRVTSLDQLFSIRNTIDDAYAEIATP